MKLTQRPVWIIAHRCNDIRDIAVASKKGANAIECDVMSSGADFVVKHGPIDFEVPTLASWLKALIKRAREFHLLYIDYKGPSFSPQAGARLVACLRKAQVPNSNIRVIVSTAQLEHRNFFRRIPNESWLAPQFDCANSPTKCQSFFQQASIPHAWYGDGVTSLWFEPGRVSRNIKKAITLREAGSVIRGVVVWTLDRPDSMAHYLKLGVNAILTNHPDDAVGVLKQTSVGKTLRKARKQDAPW